MPREKIYPCYHNSLLNFNEEESEVKMSQEEYSLLKKINNTLHLEDLFSLLVTEIKTTIKPDNYYILLADEKKEFLSVEFFETLQNKELLEVNFSVNKYSFQIDSLNPNAIAYRTKQILYANANNILQLEPFTQKFYHLYKIHEIVYIPIQHEEKVVGTIQMSNFSSAFDRNKVESFFQKLSLFAYPLENFFFKKRLEERSKEVFSILYKYENSMEILDNINNLTDTETIYHNILKSICQLFGFDGGSLWIKKGNYLCFEYYFFTNPEDEKTFEKWIEAAKSIEGYSIYEGDGGISFVYASNHYYYIPDVQSIIHSIPLTPKDKILIERMMPFVKTYLNVPIRKNKKPIGVISFHKLHQTLSLSEIELKIIDSFCSFIGTAILNCDLYSILEKQKQELERKDKIITEDLYMAKKIQQNSISQEYRKIKNMDFSVFYQPQTEIGGDIYAIHELRPHYCRIFLADATGHGIQAALATMIIQSEYSKIKYLEEKPDRLMHRINQSFIQNYYNLHFFFTAVVLDIDLENKKIYYAFAGHHKQYLTRNQELITLTSKGKMVGLLENSHYELGSLEIKDKDRIYLYTDGIFEEFSQENKELGEEGFLEFLKQAENEKYSIHTICEETVKKIFQFMGTQKQNDDMTLIGLEIKLP